MSTRCALMSSRPSSNTAKRPQGPAPMISASVLMVSVMRVASRLALGRAHDEPVQVGSDLDLAGQTRIGPHVIAEVEHVLLHGRRHPHRPPPRFVHMNV